jgi:hypothetical protein
MYAWEQLRAFWKTEICVGSVINAAKMLKCYERRQHKQRTRMQNGSLYGEKKNYMPYAKEN